MDEIVHKPNQFEILDMVCWHDQENRDDHELLLNINIITDRLKICKCCLMKLINNYSEMLQNYLSPRET